MKKYILKPAIVALALLFLASCTSVNPKPPAAPAPAADDGIKPPAAPAPAADDAVDLAAADDAIVKAAAPAQTRLAEEALVDDFTVKIAGTKVTITLPLLGEQRGQKWQWVLYARIWKKTNKGWQFASIKPEVFPVTSLDNNQVTGVLNFDPFLKNDVDGDVRGVFRLRLWGRTKDRKTWLWQDEDSPWAFPDNRGMKGYECVINLNTGEVTATPPDAASDVVQ